MDTAQQRRINRPVRSGVRSADEMREMIERGESVTISFPDGAIGVITNVDQIPAPEDIAVQHGMTADLADEEARIQAEMDERQARLERIRQMKADATDKDKIIKDYDPHGIASRAEVVGPPPGEGESVVTMSRSQYDDLARKAQSSSAQAPGSPDPSAVVSDEFIGPDADADDVETDDAGDATGAAETTGRRRKRHS